MPFRLCLAALILPTLLSAASISDLRTALQKGDFSAVSKLAHEFAMQYRVQQTEETTRQLGIENNRLMQQPRTRETLDQLIGELEVSLKQGNASVINSKARLLSLQAFLFQQANAPDPMLAFTAARDRAQAQPSFTNFYALTLNANTAKQYSAAIEAADQAFALRSTDRAASTTPEGVHAVANLAANAAFELGRMPEAEHFLLLSLSSEGQRWVRMCPDWYVADKLIDAGRREAVIQYFEKASQLPFPKCQSSIALWLNELKAGKTPKFTPPLENAPRN